MGSKVPSSATLKELDRAFVTLGLRDRKVGIELLPGAGNWYGTTLRLYNSALAAWRIPWSDPATNFFTQQIGRA